MRRMEGPRSDTMISSITVVKVAESEDSGDATNCADGRKCRMQPAVEEADTGRCCVVARQELARPAPRPIMDAGRADIEIRPRTGDAL